jgi:pimeloyl-ACP methyl ester carboxylesterase
VTDGRTRMVADAGHTVHVDRPGAVVSALESFLE